MRSNSATILNPYLNLQVFILILLKNFSNSMFTLKTFSLLAYNSMPFIPLLCWGVLVRAIWHQIDLNLIPSSTTYWPHGIKSLDIFKPVSFLIKTVCYYLQLSGLLWELNETKMWKRLLQYLVHSRFSVSITFLLSFLILALFTTTWDFYFKKI